MIKKLLIILVLSLCSLTTYSQVTANPVPDIFQCQNEVFDLTSQSPIALGNQSPNSFSVSFYLTQADAQNGVNAIPDPSFFIGGMNQVIFLSVTNMTTGEFAITNFIVSWDFQPFVGQFPDVNACMSYELPVLEVGNYYTAPNGMGTILNAGNIVTQTTMIYVHASTGFCQSETSFLVTIGIQELILAPLIGCSSDGFAEFNLGLLTQQLLFAEPNAQISYYETEVDAQNQVNALSATYFNSNAYTQTIYVGYLMECYIVSPLQLVVEDCTNNTISGVVRYDADQNGCQSTDGVAANVQVKNVNGTNTTYAYTNALGAYTFTNVQDGQNVLTLQGLTSGSVSTSQTIPVSGNDNNLNADFCITGPTPFTDVAVSVHNLNNAVPGFQHSYIMTVSNLGNTSASGLATFTYDNTMVTFNSASPTPVSTTSNSVTFSYTSLAAYNQKLHFIYFTVLPPPTVNSGDVFTVSGAVSSTQTDANLTNNSTANNLTVINSFDPNEISVAEGPYITPEQVNDYLHYMIRFQNLGTGPAVNIRVENELDLNLDWSTFTPLGASHNNYLVQRNGGDLTFQFNNINLPASQVNEPGSHGYIIYKIKPVATLAVGDMISNTASIFFDYNAAIVTNTTQTQIQSLSISDDFFAKLTTYPNPTSGIVNIVNVPSGILNYDLFDVGGKLILSATFEGDYTLNVSKLQSGLYFLKVASETESVTKKIVIK